MREKLLTALFLVVIFLIFLSVKCAPKESYEILRVIEGDKFVIDLNRNQKEDEDEVFHLKNVNSFPLRYNEKALSYGREFDLCVDEVLTLGYLGKKWANKELLHKKVTFKEGLEPYNALYGYRFVKLSLGEDDLGELLLKRGLGFAYKGSGEYNPYVQFENKKKIKTTAKEGLKEEIRALDLKKKLFHRLNCEKVMYIQNDFLDFVPLRDVPKELRECYKCHLKPHSDGEIVEKIIKVEPPMPPAAFGEIKLYLTNPNSYTKPSKFCRTGACQALLENINNAKTSIGICVYGIEGQDEILNALIAAKKRGVEVYGVTDSNSDGTFPYYDNVRLTKALPVRADNLSALMHNKFFVFDSKTVMTGSMNLSPAGAGGYNSNITLILKSPELAKVYEQELLQMVGGKFQKQKTDSSVEKVLLPSSQTLVSVYFSPRGDVYRRAIASILQSAKKEIFVNAFCITHKGIVQDLITARARGVDVKVIYDASMAFSRGSALLELRGANIPVKVENWGGKAHEKTIEVDGKYLITGSMNFSNSGITKNDENVLVIQNASMAVFYRDYFLKKLWASIDNKYLVKIPSAEGFESRGSCYDGIDNDHDGKTDSKDEGCQLKSKR